MDTCTRIKINDHSSIIHCSNNIIPINAAQGILHIRIVHVPKTDIMDVNFAPENYPMVYCSVSSYGGKKLAVETGNEASVCNAKLITCGKGVVEILSGSSWQ